MFHYLGPLGWIQSRHRGAPTGSVEQASTSQTRLGGGLQVFELSQTLKGRYERVIARSKSS